MQKMNFTDRNGTQIMPGDTFMMEVEENGAKKPKLFEAAGMDENGNLLYRSPSPVKTLEPGTDILLYNRAKKKDKQASPGARYAPGEASPAVLKKWPNGKTCPGCGDGVVHPPENLSSNGYCKNCTAKMDKERNERKRAAKQTVTPDDPTEPTPEQIREMEHEESVEDMRRRVLGEMADEEKVGGEE